MSAGVERPVAPSDRLCDALIVSFALWTVCCHAVVFAGGHLLHLLWVFAAVAIAAALVWLRYRGRGDEAAESPVSVAPTADDGRAEPATRARLAAVGFAVSVLFAYALGAGVNALWWGAAALFGVLAVGVVRTNPEPLGAPLDSTGRELALWGLALACVGLALVVHRFAIDDAFYVSMAAATADAPRQPLLSQDPLLGVVGMPLHNPVHRVHGFELWNAALSYLTGVSAIRCFHWISAALFALMIPLAYARLFRVLVPQVWLPATLAVCVFLVADGDAHRSFGNYAFVRIWHGKAILIHVALPLIAAHALRFGAQSTAARWGMLAAAQVAAVGWSSTGLWVGPLSAALALASTQRLGRRGFAVVAVGLIASAYPLAVGTAIKGQAAAVTQPHIEAAEVADEGEKLAETLELILGRGRHELVALGAVLLGWAVWPGAARRWAVCVVAGSLWVVLNPYWETFVLRHVTGPSHYRAMWLLPVPTLAALLLTAPFALRFPIALRAPTLLRTAVFALLLLAVGFGSSERTTLGASAGATRGAQLGLPRLKVDPSAYAAAARLTHHVPAGAIVVAPAPVSVWIPTFHDRAHPLSVRPLYLRVAERHLGADDVKRRHNLTMFVQGWRSDLLTLEAFRSGLEAYEVSGVCLGPRNAREVRPLLRSLGFEPREATPNCEIWTRTPHSQSAL